MDLRDREAGFQVLNSIVMLPNRSGQFHASKDPWHSSESLLSVALLVMQRQIMTLTMEWHRAGTAGTCYELNKQGLTLRSQTISYRPLGMRVHRHAFPLSVFVPHQPGFSSTFFNRGRHPLHSSRDCFIRR